MVGTQSRLGAWLLAVGLGSIAGAGCGRPVEPTSGPGSPAMIGKVEAPASQAAPDPAAQAMGGSGMPATAAGSTGAGQPKVFVDGKADTAAQAMGGSGMPATR